MTTTEVQIFSKKNGMWNGYASCLGWRNLVPEKREPVFREVQSIDQSWLFIADSQTVQAFSDDGEIIWGSNLTFPTQECAKAFLRGIEDDFSFVELGFFRV